MSDAQAPPFVKKDFACLVHDLLQEIQQIRGDRQPLTDTHEGSVVRTLVETFAHEMAVAYEQLERVYNNAYLDSAQGASLDKVVDLLAIKRYQAGRLEGIVTFSRATPATEAIHIPAGTLVAGKGVAACVTLQPVTLEKGQTAVNAVAISQEPGADKIQATMLNTMPRPISGIEKVSNPGDLTTRQRAETDEELRQRSQRSIQASRAGTTAALEEAVRALGLKHIKVLEYAEHATHDEDSDPLSPGMIKVIVGDTFKDDNEKTDTMKRVEDCILEVKPAGVMVRCQAAALVEVKIHATLILSTEQDRRQQQQLEQAITHQLRKYFSRLAVGESVYEDKVRALLLNVPEVERCETNPSQVSLLQAEAITTEQKNLLLKPNKRAILAKDQAQDQAIRLILQNPDLPVWLNIALTSTDTSKDTLDKLKKGCEQWIQESGKQLTLKSGEQLTLNSQAFWDALYELDSQLSQIQLTFIYPHNGRVVEWKITQDQDKQNDLLPALNPREKLELKQFTVKGEATG